MPCEDDVEAGYRCGLPPSVVGAYENVFFHVRDKPRHKKSVVHCVMVPKVRGERGNGPGHGNFFGWTVKEVLAAVDGVLEREWPEMATVMVGTNDVSGRQMPDSYRAGREKVVAKCLEAHCVPVLNTVPPRRGLEEALQKANDIVRDVARERCMPLVDDYAEVLRRRPEGSWQGTLVALDDVHPTAGETNVDSPETRGTAATPCGTSSTSWRCGMFASACSIPRRQAVSCLSADCRRKQVRMSAHRSTGERTAVT